VLQIKEGSFKLRHQDVSDVGNKCQTYDCGGIICHLYTYICNMYKVMNNNNNILLLGTYAAGISEFAN